RTAFGLLVELKTPVIYQVVNHLAGGGGGKGLAVNQSIAQIGRQMPPEKRPARIFRRPHAPLAKPAAKFPNVAFHLVNDFVMIDWHGCSLSLESEILNLSLAPCARHSSLVTRHCCSAAAIHCPL